MVEMNFSATSHTLRALASAGIVTATAAAVFGAALLAPAAALADEPEPIVSAVEKEDAARNFAVNLPEGTNAATLDESARIAEQLGAVVLSKYPAFATMFVQAKSKSFAQDYANVLKTAGITLNSIGPTRTAVVTGTEDVVDKDAARSSQAPTELQKNSQFYDETQLQDDNDPYTTIDKAWGILALEADKARQVTDSSVKLEPVTVGVVDSGIDYKHFKDTDFKDRIDTADSVSCATNGNRPPAVTVRMSPAPSPPPTTAAVWMASRRRTRSNSPLSRSSTIRDTSTPSTPCAAWYGPPTTTSM